MKILLFIIGMIIYLIIYFIIRFLGRYSDKKLWNGGICKITGKPWKLVCDDFNDALCFESGPYHIWISRKTELFNYKTYVLEYE